MRKLLGLTVAFALIVVAPACDKEEKGDTKKKEAAPTIKVDSGVDLETKTIHVGALNDMSGPGAVIGKPFAVGKQVLFKQINAGGSGLLPEGWKIELHEEDHGYNPTKAVTSFKTLQDKVLFITTSFGTPNTLPLRPHLQRAKLMAFPASLSSEMAANDWHPPLAPSYKVEAMRAMDFAVENAGGADKVKAAIVYQKDDYGKDGIEGWKAAAAKHGVTIVAEEQITPGQKDMTAVVTKLKEAAPTHVLLTVLPTQAATVIGTAAQQQLAPVWIGNTPAWVDLLFAGKLAPTAIFANFYWANGLPFWAEKVPGMDKFLAAFEAHGGEQRPDFYVLASYIQGLIQVEALKRAIEAGDVTREGFAKQIQAMKDWDAGGLIQPIDLTVRPYNVSNKTRILKPDFANKSWTVASDYAAPKALE